MGAELVTGFVILIASQRIRYIVMPSSEHIIDVMDFWLLE